MVAGLTQLEMWQVLNKRMKRYAGYSPFFNEKPPALKDYVNEVCYMYRSGSIDEEQAAMLTVPIDEVWSIEWQ